MQKAATSTLFSMLQHHPQVATSPRKELHFFDDESRDWTRPDYTTYGVDRAPADCAVAVDATPVYLFWPRAMARMRDYDPQMLLIACFRDPIERAYSHWAMQASRRESYPSFDRVVRKWGTTRHHDEVPDGWTAGLWRTRSIVARGFYGGQLDHGLSLFPREQWLLLSFGDVVRRPDEVGASIQEFLGLEPTSRQEPPRPRHKGRYDQARAAPSPRTIETLAEWYEDDLRRFAALSAIDVGDWTTQQLLDGRTSADVVAQELASK